MQIEKNLVTMEDLACGVGMVKQVRGGQDLSLNRLDVPLAVPVLADLANVDITKYVYARVGEAEYRYVAEAKIGERSLFGLGKWVQVSKQCAEYALADLPDAAQLKGAIMGLVSATGLPSPVVYSDGTNWLYMNNTVAK